VKSFSFLQSFRVVLAQGWADFLLKYRGSFLGYLWSFIVPLVKFLVILHVFGRYTQEIQLYPLYLFLGIILWEHFSLLTSACIQLPQDKALIIKKVAFPRALLVLSTGWMHMIILATYCIIFFAFSLYFTGSIPLSAVLYLPIVMLQSSLIALGVGMILGSYALKFRDIQHLWGVLLTILFWLTPIMYQFRPDAPLLADAKAIFTSSLSLSLWNIFDLFIRFQPLSILIHDAQRSMLYPETLGIPSAVHIIGFTLICALIFSIGLWIFQRRSPYFIQEY
jgi:ABC-2 type transport system permease protein